METNVDIEHDIGIIQRNYSSLRKINKKWMTNNIGDQEAVPMRYMLFRSSIKRSPMFFKEFLFLWNEINPHNLRGISQNLYSLVNSFLYSELADSEDQQSEFVNQDLNADFQGNSSLTFCETYDSFFELVDSNTKSRLVCEYIKTLRSFVDRIRTEELLKFFNFWSKKHLDDEKRICYQKWMLQHFKDMKELKNASSKLADISDRKFCPPTFLKRPQRNLYANGDVTVKKIKKMICFSQRAVKTHQSPRPVHVPRLKQKSAKGKMRIQAKKRSFNRENYKLEEIIKNRKILNDNQLEGN